MTTPSPYMKSGKVPRGVAKDSTAIQANALAGHFHSLHTDMISTDNWSAKSLSLSSIIGTYPDTTAMKAHATYLALPPHSFFMATIGTTTALYFKVSDSVVQTVTVEAVV